jgi:hypothetical protein
MTPEECEVIISRADVCQAIIEAIDAAVKAERERCAKIASEFPWTLSAGSENIPMVDMDALVDAIRKAHE